MLLMVNQGPEFKVPVKNWWNIIGWESGHTGQMTCSSHNVPAEGRVYYNFFVLCSEQLHNCFYSTLKEKNIFFSCYLFFVVSTLLLHLSGQQNDR